MVHIRNIGQKEIRLPSHMTSLPQAAIEIVSSMRASAVRVVSCGIDPKDGNLYLVTANADVRYVKPGDRIKPSSAHPSHDGRTIGLTLSGDTKTLHVVRADQTLARSESCFTAMSSLTVNDTYLGDLEFEAVFPKENHEDKAEPPEKDNR